MTTRAIKTTYFAYSTTNFVIIIWLKFPIQNKRYNFMNGEHGLKGYNTLTTINSLYLSMLQNRI